MNGKRRILFRSALSSCVMIGISSCGSDPPSTQQPIDTEDGDSGCSRPGDTYRVGMAKTSTSGSVTVELADANPAPPGYGENHWSLKVTDASQLPVAAAKVNLTLRMPDHADHMMPGTLGVPTSDGTYDVSNLGLTMAGLYNITVEVVPEAGASDSVVFQFCVARKGN
jgi:hypothetical protein